MKYNKLYIAFLILATTLFAGCSEFEDSVEPSPKVADGSQGVYFPTSNAEVFELEPTQATEITLTIARVESSGAVDVPVTVGVNDEDIFNIPESVSFADGETEVDFVVTFPEAAEGVTYDLRLAVEGEQYVNPYASALPYVETNVTRIKWEPVEEPIVYVDGTFSAFFGVNRFPMYVQAEKAQLGESVRYRFKNVYRIPVEGADADGIYDGYPYNAPGDVDESKDYYTTIEIYDPEGKAGDVFMFSHPIGTDWGYGMFSIGSVYQNMSDDISEYPLGTLINDVVTFPSSSLFTSMADYNGGEGRVASDPTYIYLTKEAFIAANLKIVDFNDVEYEEIAGEVGEFESNAYSDNWSQTLSAAIDLDEENEESDYKNLFYLADLYATDYGLAFYYYEEDGKVIIPENQPIGLEYMGKKVYVSGSDEIDSSVEVNSKGVTIYSLGLMFHFEDGTMLGEFSEVFYYSEGAVSYDKADFLGDFVMTGLSQFGDDDANMEVNIAEGLDANTFSITGIDYAEEIIATFDATNSTMSIAPQTLPDVELSSGIYDATLYTTDADGVSSTSEMEFTFNMQGNLIISTSSVGDGYLIDSQQAGGWLDGYYDLVFTPVPVQTTKSAGMHISGLKSFSVYDDSNFKIRTNEEIVPGNNFEIQGNKMSTKYIKENVLR